MCMRVGCLEVRLEGEGRVGAGLRGREGRMLGLGGGGGLRGGMCVLRVMPLVEVKMRRRRRGG
jgi:hypothetical protein